MKQPGWEVGERVVLHRNLNMRSIVTVESMTKTAFTVTGFNGHKFDIGTGRAKGDYSSFSRPYVSKLTSDVELSIMIEGAKWTLRKGFEHVQVNSDNLDEIRSAIAIIRKYQNDKE